MAEHHFQRFVHERINESTSIWTNHLKKDKQTSLRMTRSGVSQHRFKRFFHERINIQSKKLIAKRRTNHLNSLFTNEWTNRHPIEQTLWKNPNKITTNYSFRSEPTSFRTIRSRTVRHHFERFVRERIACKKTSKYYIEWFVHKWINIILNDLFTKESTPNRTNYLKKYEQT